MGISFQTARRWRKNFVRGASQGGRLGPGACITTGLIVLLEKEIIFVYVVFKAVKLYNHFTILYGAASPLKKRKFL
jgi:hypothetical protein